MARMTLLDMTQNILSAMDSDDVNSISDTVESLQVARIIVETYDELYANMDDPSMWGIVRLQSLVDVTRPNVMRIPDDVQDIKWIKYNGNDVTYQDPEDFILAGVSGGDTKFDDFTIWTDRDPTRWTTFNNNEVVFNSINNDLDGVLQESKTLCWGKVVPKWDFKDDAYAPYLSAGDYPGLLAEAKSTCFVNLKSVASSKEEQRSKRQRVRRQGDQWRLNQRKPYESSVDFGRRRRRG
jgi:hypothetical protein